MLTKLDEKCRKVLTVLADLMYRTTQSGGDIGIQFQELGNSVPGTDVVVPTGVFLFVLQAKLGDKAYKSTSDVGLLLPGGNTTKDDLNPAEADPDALTKNVVSKIVEYLYGEFSVRSQYAYTKQFMNWILKKERT